MHYELCIMHYYEYGDCMKRVFLIVLDSFGIGAMPDAASFGDPGTNTLKSCAQTGSLHVPNMQKAGLGNIDGVDCLPDEDAPIGAYGRLTERSMGKDTTIGHWEIAGIVSEAYSVTSSVTVSSIVSSTVSSTVMSESS